MDPVVGYGREAGGLLGGIAKLIGALRGSSPHFEVEARHVPEKLRVPCSNCDRTAQEGKPEHFLVTVHALTSERYLRVRAAGICNSAMVVRRLRWLVRKPAWHEVKATPFGGVDSPRFSPEILRRFGERRGLPATVEPGNPLSFKLMIPAEWPWGIQRGGKLRVWVGKPAKGGLVSDVIELPHLDEQEPSPKLCRQCQTLERARQAQLELRRRSRAEPAE